jgi:hypothetical protein
MPRPAAVTQPDPPANPFYTPPKPLAPIVHRRFEQDGHVITIVQHQEINCCGTHTIDEHYTAIVGEWEPTYAFTFADSTTRARRTVNWRTMTTTHLRGYAGELLVRRTIRSAITAARRKVHEHHLLTTHGARAQEVGGPIETGEQPGRQLDTGTPGQVVLATWGRTFWYAVIAEVDEHGKVAYVVLCDMPPHEHRTRVLRVGPNRHVRALYAPPGA